MRKAFDTDSPGPEEPSNDNGYDEDRYIYD